MKAGTPRSGYLGIEEGAYAFQHAQIGLLMQVVGIVVCLGVGMITAAILAFLFERTIGFRVPEKDQADGLDQLYWGIDNDLGASREPVLSAAEKG